MGAPAFVQEEAGAHASGQWGTRARLDEVSAHAHPLRVPEEGDSPGRDARRHLDADCSIVEAQPGERKGDHCLVRDACRPARRSCGGSVGDRVDALSSSMSEAR